MGGIILKNSENIFQNFENSNLKIRFVKNLHYACDGICLFWIDEIHIDEKWKDHQILPDIIKHEKKHYEFYQKMINSKTKISKIYWYIRNELFDIYDCIRLDLKLLYFKLLRLKRKIKGGDGYV